MTRFGVVATSVSMPLVSAAMLTGMSMRARDTPDWRAMRMTMGMKIATTAVELMTEPIKPTRAMINTTSRRSFEPPRAIR